MGRREQILESNYKAVRDDIYAFCQALNFKPTWQQRQLLDLVQKPSPSRKRIAVKSGKGPGKSTVSGVIGLWWALRNYGTKIILTAPTMRQCKDIWLAEVGRTMGRADPWLQNLIEITGTRVKIAGHNNWGVQIMTASSPEAALGFHEKNLKVIVEEASGVDRAIMRSLKDTLSNPNSAMLMIGNPTLRDGDFFDAFSTARGDWETLTFNAEDTPASDWFDPNRNREIEEEFGRNSDVYRVAVLGEFPHTDPNCIMSSDDLEKVISTENMRRCALLSKKRQFGIDLSRFGGDESTIYRRSGEAIVQWGNWARIDPSWVLRNAMLWQRQAGWKTSNCLYVPDAGGMGQGAMHVLHDRNRQVFEFHTNSKAFRAEMFANLGTEAWFQLARKVKSGLCYLPNDQMLLQQLSTRQYGLNKMGQILIESKDEYKKRTKSGSPDRADGLIMAMMDVDEAGHVEVMAARGHSKTVGVEHR